MPPQTPTITASTPPSPANDTSPELHGSAEAGTDVHFYADAACSAAEIGSGSAAAFSGPDGITASVEANHLSEIRALAVDELGNRSGCSEPLAYEEDSMSPQLSALTTSPAGGGDDQLPEVLGQPSQGPGSASTSAPSHG